MAVAFCHIDALPPAGAWGTLRALARRDSSPDERASWVQTNTEFHRDWTEQQNQGHHVKWKSGLSLEQTKEDRRRHAAQIAPRRPRRFFFWLVIASVAIGCGYLFFRGL